MVSVACCAGLVCLNASGAVSGDLTVFSVSLNIHFTHCIVLRLEM